MNYDHDAHEHLVRSCRKTRAWPDEPQYKGPHFGKTLVVVLLVSMVVGAVLRWVTT